MASLGGSKAPPLLGYSWSVVIRTARRCRRGSDVTHLEPARPARLIAGRPAFGDSAGATPVRNPLSCRGIEPCRAPAAPAQSPPSPITHATGTPNTRADSPAAGHRARRLRLRRRRRLRQPSPGCGRCRGRRGEAGHRQTVPGARIVVGPLLVRHPLRMAIGPPHRRGGAMPHNSHTGD